MPTVRLVSAPAPAPAPATIEVGHLPADICSGDGPREKMRCRAGRPNCSKTDSGTPFVDLTGIPPQPLILKNALSRGGNYEDNTRRRPVKAGSSKYTGVYLDNYNSVRKPTWKAQIMVDGRVRSIGFYESEEDAAGDYARAAFKYKVHKNESKYGGLDLRDILEQSLIVSNSATGYKGVKKMKGRWQARITVKRGASSKTLGTFDSAEEAAAIYARAAFYLEQWKTRGRRQEGGATVGERTDEEQIIDLKTSAIHV